MKFDDLDDKSSSHQHDSDIWEVDVPADDPADEMGKERHAASDTRQGAGYYDIVTVEDEELQTKHLEKLQKQTETLKELSRSGGGAGFIVLNTETEDAHEIRAQRRGNEDTKDKKYQRLLRQILNAQDMREALNRMSAILEELDRLKELIEEGLQIRKEHNLDDAILWLQKHDIDTTGMNADDVWLEMDRQLGDDVETYADLLDEAIELAKEVEKHPDLLEENVEKWEGLKDRVEQAGHEFVELEADVQDALQADGIEIQNLLNRQGQVEHSDHTDVISPATLEVSTSFAKEVLNNPFADIQNISNPFNKAAQGSSAQDLDDELDHAPTTKPFAPGM